MVSEDTEGVCRCPLIKMLFAGESQTLEFKTSVDKATVESLVAFANAQGGTVLVGVSDTGEVVGVTLGKETLKRIAIPGVLQQKVELITGSVESSEKILTLLASTVQMTTNELAEKLGVGQRAVEKQIEKLKREGRLQRIGTDKGGHWQVQKVEK